MAASTTIPSINSEQPAIQRISLIFPFALYIAGALIFFRWQILSRFDLIFGDRGDARFVAFIHEHEYQWLLGHARLLSPPFFFNQPNTLGYSDAFLLDQIVYAPLRFLGVEPFLALSLIAVILSAVAYLFLYLFLRRFGSSILLASLCAFIFTFANNLYLKSIHLQHFTVYYIPIVAYCGLLAVSELHRSPFRSYVLAATAAGLYGLLFSTGYYMSWFFGLGLLIFSAIAAIAAWSQLRDWWRRHPYRVLTLGLVASLSFVAALSIFAVIYAPVLEIGSRRTFADYLTYAPRPMDIINVGMENLVWSKIILSLHLFDSDRLGYTEASIALTPIVQILVLISAVVAFCSRFWPNTDIGRIHRATVIASASVCALFYLLAIQVHGHSLFHILYAIVPGADAIRIGYRGMIVANLFAVTAIGLTFDWIARHVLQNPRTSLRWAQFAGLAALLLLAAIEQVNLSRRTFLSRKFEQERIAGVGKAPLTCQSFYAAPQSDHQPTEVQIDAMMVALAQHLPTIDGYSGLFPPGWDFYDTNAADYEQRAARWAVKHGITAGLCRVDVDRGTWTSQAVDRGLFRMSR